MLGLAHFVAADVHPRLQTSDAPKSEALQDVRLTPGADLRGGCLHPAADTKPQGRLWAVQHGELRGF